ncbi:MAG: hypothetical protein A2Y74_04465 [Actinobacteria bacterium RBG_13_63_9]|nr:MAG: hypothetical protein A2Y74_04465 [Actinobacteria bacterium RBG_13_63_9]
MRNVRALVTGSREWTDRALIHQVLSRLPAGSVVIHGGARGVDRLAGSVARELVFAEVEFRADWRLGKKAGYLRNQRMLTLGEPDVVLAFHSDLASSKGTADMVRRARKAGVPVEVYDGSEG